MAIVYLWISSHFLACTFFFRRQERFFFEILMALTISCVYFYKSPTYDLIVYLEYFSNPYPYEIGFWKTTEFFIQNLFLKPEEILLFWQSLILTILFLSNLRISPRRYLLSFIVVSLSLSTFLSSQNALRQGIALSVLIYGVVNVCITNKLSVTFLLCTIVATLFHHTTPLFSFILAIFFILNGSLIKKHAMLTPISGALLGFVVLFFLKINFSDSIYLDQNNDWGPERTSSWIKYLLIALIFTASQHIAIGKIIARNNIFFKLREFYFFFLLPIAFLPEIFARLSLLYFFIESLLIFFMLSSSTQKFRLAGILIILSYGLAPNAINIIIGRGHP